MTQEEIIQNIMDGNGLKGIRPGDFYNSSSVYMERDSILTPTK